MLLVTELLRWWYGDGWRHRAQLIMNRLDGTIDYFSIDLLIKTLFAPFRQISAGRVDGPLGVQFRAFIDRLFSRVIGALIRLLILIIGGVSIVIQVVLGFVVLVVWATIPILPFIGLAISIMGLRF